MAHIDLNADLGETIDGRPTADDAAMFAVVSSANIACGGHAGDVASMRTSVELAARGGVAIGAHPSYADRENFGRVARTPEPAELRREVSRQLAALEAAGAVIRYVKPHGALYHAVTADPGQADAVVDAIAELSERAGRGISVLGLGGEIEKAASVAGLPFMREAFLDRGYLPDGGLVSRTRPGALLDDPARVAARAVRLVHEGLVDDVDGGDVAVEAVSLCVHGDSPGAVAMARAVRTALTGAGIEIRAPW